MYACCLRKWAGVENESRFRGAALAEWLARSTAKSELSGSNPGAPTTRSPGEFGEKRWVELLLPVTCIWGRKTWVESDGMVGKTPSQARKQVTALGTTVLGHGEARASTDISASAR